MWKFNNNVNLRSDDRLGCSPQSRSRVVVDPPILMFSSFVGHLSKSSGELYPRSAKSERLQVPAEFH
jgi:hypothetical protein